jgi:hypothetical protein
MLDAIRLNLRRKLAGTDCNVDVPRPPPTPRGPRPGILIPSAIRGNMERISLCRYAPALRMPQAATIVSSERGRSTPTTA